jgi:site-specific DNA recombinase
VCRPNFRPERQLDELVVGALVGHLLSPERLPSLLQEVARHHREVMKDHRARRSDMQRLEQETAQKIQRLYMALADGLVVDTDMFRLAINELETKRAEATRLLGTLDREGPGIRQALSHSQARSVATTLRRRFMDAPRTLQRRHVHGLVSDILVDREKAVVAGPKDALALAVSSRAFNGEVRSSVREWRALGESNPSCKIENLES